MTSRIEHNDPRVVGSFSLTYHYEMLSDMKRVMPFLRAIEELCPGKVVFESGTGSGVLSIMAARAGAKAVYCSEIDPKVATFARENIERSGLAQKITLIQKSTLEIGVNDIGGIRPDVLMAENLSTWQVTEPQNQVMNHLRQQLAHSKSISIPARTRNYVQLCQSEYTFFDTVQLRTHYFEFSGIRGPIIRSKPALFSIFDYSRENPTRVEGELVVEALSAGLINSLRVTSPIDLSDTNYFDASDSLMPPVIVPLAHDVEAKAGDKFVISVQYQTNTRWEDVRCDIRPAQ